MRELLFSVFVIVFWFINYKIIISDLKYKKIPNKNLLQLLILIPFWYLYLYFFPFWEINILNFLLQIFVSFLVSFLLFNFWIWKAWDAKYLLVLSLFTPYIWIIPFVWNLWIFTIFYLFLFFIWFFIWRSIFYKWYFKSLVSSIKLDLKNRWRIYKNQKWWKSFFIIFKWIIVFLIIFVSIRLFRIYLFLGVFKNFLWNTSFLNIFEKYHFYLVFLWIFSIISIIYLWKKLINYLKITFANNLKINLSIVWNIFLWILFVFLVSFIVFEFQKSPEEISKYLVKIFTLYIVIYIFVKIIFYWYKTSFIWNEKKTILLKDLKESDYLDIQCLDKIFYFRNEKWEEWFKELYNKAIIWNNFDIKNLKILIRISNNYDKRIRKLEKERLINSVTVIKTFSFAPYILLGFIVTFIFWNKIIIFFLIKIIEFLGN